MITSFHIGDRTDQFVVASKIEKCIDSNCNQLVLVDWRNECMIGKIKNALNLFDVKVQEDSMHHIDYIVVRKRNRLQKVYFTISELTKQYCSEINTRYVHLFLDYRRTPYNQIAYIMPRFTRIERLFIYVDKNYSDNKSTQTLDKFNESSKKATFEYDFKSRKINGECCPASCTICNKCAYTTTNEIVDEKYVCFVEKRIITPALESTPFDDPMFYPICSIVSRENNCLKTFVTQDCPYYVEHYLQLLKKENTQKSTTGI